MGSSQNESENRPSFAKDEDSGALSKLVQLTGQASQILQFESQELSAEGLFDPYAYRKNSPYF
jgi:hypothetical protein